MASNINAVVSSNGTIKSGTTVGGKTTDEQSLSRMNKALKSSAGLTLSEDRTKLSESYLNKTASTMSGIGKTASNATYSESGETAEPNEDFYNQFLNTVAPYVKMTDEEKRYYYNISGIISKNGMDVSQWAEDFLCTNAVANALGVSRTEVSNNRSYMLKQYLGIEEEQPLTFTWTASLINAFKQGVRQQDMAGEQKTLRDLYAKGYNDDSYLVQKKTQDVLQIENEMNYYQDSTERTGIGGALTEWIQSSIQQIPYMLDGSLSGIIGSIVGGAIAGPTGAKIGNYALRYLTYRDQFEASAFWNMKQAGISTENALKFSKLDGIVNGLNEALLDVIAGQFTGKIGEKFGINLSDSLVSSFINKVTRNGSLKSLVGRAFLYMGLDSSGEFLQEGSESLTSAFFESWAEIADGNKDVELISKEDWQDAWDEGIQGFLNGLFFGIGGAAVNVMSDIPKATRLKNTAIHTLSEESFVNNESNRNLLKSFKLGGADLSEEQISDHLSGLYQSTQSARTDIKNNIRPEIFEQLKTMDGSLNEDVYNNMTISDKEIKDEKGEVISGKGTEVKTKDDGSLYFVIDNATASDDGKSTTYTMRIANPNVVGTSQIGEAYVDAKTAGMESDVVDSLKTAPQSLAMEQAGKITFTVNEEDDTLTIDSVQIQNDSSSLKKQAVQELSDMYPEYNITWENQTESDKAVFADIESGNPRNTSQKTYGLNYREKISSDDADTAYVKRWLGNKFSEDNSENSLMATIVQAAAKARGLSGKEFIGKYLNEIQDISDSQSDPNTKGYTKTQRDEVTKQVKATIYAGKNADPTTFLHELHHTVMLMESNMKEFSDIYQKVKGTKQFRAWLEKNRDIILNSTAVRNAIAQKDKDGNLIRDEKGRVLIDEAKLDNLFKSGDKWTTAEFELEARIYEAYMRSGQTFNPTLTGFFKRVAETFRQIYRSLRNGFSSVRLNDEIVEYYDRLYGYDKQTGTTSKLSGSGDLTHLSERLEKVEKTDTLKQETETDEEYNELSKLSASEQYRAIKKQFYGTDKYMIAPNGKASNLSERQWIQVRTPNFLEWGGDWINDPEHASVILDENGEPKQLYHGSPKKRITVFNNRGRVANGGEEGLTYATDSIRVADRFSEEVVPGEFFFTVTPTGKVGKVYPLFMKMSNPLDFRHLTEQNLNDIRETFLKATYGENDNSREAHLDYFRKYLSSSVRLGHFQSIKNLADTYLSNLEAYGYDGIIVPMGTQRSEEIYRDALEYAVPSPNQVKSADRNNGEFSLEDDSILKQESDDVLMQFVGEVAASNVEELPNAMSNRLIAEEMEESGKDAIEIWTATGWFRGTDTKWRMEIPDTVRNLDFTTEEELKEHYSYNTPYSLSDFIDERLMKLYPSLSDVSVTFYSNKWDDRGGDYNPDNKKLRINTVGLSEIKNVLVHEVQHAIQSIEGFSSGGSAGFIQSLVKEKVNELRADYNRTSDLIAPYKEFKKYVNDYVIWRKALENPDENVRHTPIFFRYGDYTDPKNKKESHQQVLDAIEKARPTYTEEINKLQSILSSDSNELDKDFIPSQMIDTPLDDSSLEDISELLNKAEEKIRAVTEETGLDKKGAELYKYVSLRDGDAYTNYLRLYGEVEARNSAKRYRQNLYNKFPLYTEDVSPETQLVMPQDRADVFTSEELNLRQEDDTQKKEEPKYKTIEEAEAALTEFKKKNGVKIDRNAVRVNVSDVHELYRLAEDARGEFSETINKLQRDLGVPADMAFSRTSLKGFDRVIEKTVNDYDGDVGRVIDINGSTFMFDSFENAESAFSKAVSLLGDKVVKQKALSTSGGYRDFKVNFQTSNGFIGELIIIDEDTAWVKNNGIGHAIYEESRRLDPYLKKDKNAFKEYQKLFGMDVWSAISKLNESLDEWSSVVYANAKAIRYGQYDSAGFTANLYAVSSDITELSLLLRSNFAASYSDGSSSYTLPSDATLSMDTSPDAESLLNAVSQISKYLTAMLNSSNQNVTQLETEVKNKEDLDALQTQSQQAVQNVALSGDSLAQMGDDEWTENAKRIALQAPSLEEFFKLYREQVENGEVELEDSNAALLLSDIYDETRQNSYEDFDESYFDNIESEDEVDEDDFWKVEDEEPSENTASASDSSEEVPDWFDIDNPKETAPTEESSSTATETEDTEEDEDDFWKVEDEEESDTATATASTEMPNDVPDWFDLDAEETSATETEQSIKDMEDSVTEVQKVVVDSDLPNKLSLDHSRSLNTSHQARAVEFASILRESKEETIKFLQTLKEVNAEFFYNEVRMDPEQMSEEDYNAQEMRKSAFDEFGSISKFIQNLIYDSKGATVSRNLNSLSDRAWKIVAGQVAKNAEVYMDLYARASNNSEWAGDNSIEAQVLAELKMTENEWNNLSYYKRQMYLQDIADKEFREKIRSGQVYDKDLRDYISRAEEKAEASLAEAKAIEESQNYIIDENKKTILKLSTGAKAAQQKIADLQSEQAEVQDKIDKLVIRMEQKLKKKGVSVEKETQAHAELVKRQNALKKREAQYQKALDAWQNKNLKKADTTALTKEMERVRDLYRDAQKKVDDLLTKNYLTPDEALERLENLYKTWKDTELKNEIDKIRTQYRDKLKDATKDKNDALKKQYQKVSDHYKSRLKQATKDKNDALKKAHKKYMEAMRERDAIRKVREEKERLAKQIMKRPSGNVALEEAQQIRAIQALIDPAYRRSTMKTIDGVKYTVEELKKILNNNPQDPVLQKLTEKQLERLTKISLDEMSLAQVQNVYQYINKLREDGLNKRRNEILQRKSENQIIYNSLMETLRKNPKFKEYGFEGTEDKKNRQNTKTNKVRDAWYQTLNMARKAQTLDNGEKGVFYDLLIRKKRLLQSEEMKNVMARSKKIEDIIKQNKLSDSLYKTWSATLENGRNVTFTTSELAYIYLSQNCEDNRDAIAYGTLISTEERANIVNAAEKAIVGTGKGVVDARNNKVDADIRSLGDWRYNAVLKLATEVVEKDKGIFSLVKAIEADFNDPSFNRVVDLVRRLYNVEVQKQKYYLPINRTDFLGKEPGEDIKNDLLNQVPGTRGNVQKGFTKDRQVIAPRNQKAVKYDLFKVWTNAVKNQEHFLSSQEYVNQLNSIFVTSNTKTNTLRANIENTYGKGMLDSIDTHIKEIADPNAGAVQTDPAKEILKAAKGNIYSAYLGFKLSGITNQLITSPAAFFGKVNPVRYASNFLQMVNPATFKKTREEVFNLSPFMKSRNFDIIAGEIKDAAEQVGMPKYKKAWYGFLNFGLSGLEWADQVTVVAGWKAIYEQELQKLGASTEENIRKAVQIADEYVQETQPQSDKTEIAPLYKNKNEMLNILLQFQSSLNVIWNNLAYDTVNSLRRKKNLRTAIGTIFGYASAGVLLSLAHGDFQPDEDDDDYSFWRTFYYSATSQGIESIPIFSSYIDSIFGYVVNNEKPNYSTTSITPFPMLAEAFNAGKYTVQAVKEREAEYLTKATEKGANALMLATGLPYSGIKELKAMQDAGLQALIGAR